MKKVDQLALQIYVGAALFGSLVIPLLPLSETSKVILLISCYLGCLSAALRAILGWLGTSNITRPRDGLNRLAHLRKMEEQVAGRKRMQMLRSESDFERYKEYMEEKGA